MACGRRVVGAACAQPRCSVQRRGHPGRPWSGRAQSRLTSAAARGVATALARCRGSLDCRPCAHCVHGRCCSLRRWGCGAFVAVAAPAGNENGRRGTRAALRATRGAEQTAGQRQNGARRSYSRCLWRRPGAERRSDLATRGTQLPSAGRPRDGLPRAPRRTRTRRGSGRPTLASFASARSVARTCSRTARRSPSGEVFAVRARAVAATARSTDAGADADADASHRCRARSAAAC